MIMCLLSCVSFRVDTKVIPNDGHFLDNKQQYYKMSNLDFSFQSEHDVGKENKLLMTKSSFWGRLYLNGFPNRKGTQYFRAHFGSVPPTNEITFTLASSSLCKRDIATTQEREFDKMDDLIVVELRGNCTFEEKAWTAQQYGARGILFVNNEVSASVTFHIILLANCQKGFKVLLLIDTLLSAILLYSSRKVIFIHLDLKTMD